ncbi:hypothetical protein Pan241w_36400 [Gimesia alba]|uniref:Uncharacterized protein n=1 Tax=Gimesia alba TaxID=2527973 RepID=A0A517RI41_9PLAN|nr:hypothetical protein Pan241w_36400 [Gimesia alba]
MMSLHNMVRKRNTKFRGLISARICLNNPINCQSLLKTDEAGPASR